MGYPLFDFPGELKTNWMKPLDAWGFEIETDGIENHITPTGHVIAYRNGGVHWRNHSMGIVGQPGDDIVGFLLGINASGNEPLLATVARILFASGAQSTSLSSMMNVKKLYLIPEVSLRKCINRIAVAEAFLWEEAISANNLLDSLTIHSLDLIGFARKRGLTVSVFAGQGFDVELSQKTFYIALDNHKSLFQSRRSLDIFFAQIEKTLIDCDAKPLQLVLTDWSP